ncbi:hypothetical protein I204_08130 [Kwoniella mangroviensis CBS 8886]|uniref:uncharacterized protein n=1 Tax=Kwoniella mangroviensis CBS 8507 TaxID=1296122 RepID=UPI00080D3752|nr:uncharacterized protein I203_04510 [Kwoniella mangroviensis CBS 8507]OCF66184.1 hypothetical protein I203_04510 [Kwoniella mangroviensis CBS 8507]OCF71177.1 hypothetical protein I204_08130 [Kwoniella mangroviensis CBS 8886]
MPGRYLLRCAQSTFYLVHHSNESSKLKDKLEPSHPTRSLSDSCLGSTPKIECTTGPTVLRSVINPNWKPKKERNVNHLRCTTLSERRRLVEVEEEIHEDTEIPFELDENLPTSPSFASPAHSLLTTPTFPNSPTISDPFDFGSYGSGCEHEECIDPSLCSMSYGSSFNLNHASSSRSFMNKVQFANSPIYQYQEEEQCSWASSPILPSKLAYGRKGSNDSTCSQNTDSTSNSDLVSDTNAEDERPQDDLSNILSGCGSLIDDASDSFLQPTSSLSSPSLSHQRQYSSCLFLHDRAKQMKINQSYSLSSSTTSPIHSPRSDENTIKSVGFKPSPPQQVQRLLEQSRLSLSTSSSKSQRRLSMIRESE